MAVRVDKLTGGKGNKLARVYKLTGGEGIRTAKKGRTAVNIKLKPKNKKDGDVFYFASMPESIRRSMGAKMQSFDIVSKGTVKVPKGTEAREYSWDGVFFGPDRKNEPLVKKKYWKQPQKCVKILRKWMDRGTALNLIVSGSINVDVTITSLEFEDFGAYGDIRYSIKFTQKRALKVYTTKELKIATFAKKTKERGNKNDEAQTGKGNYTVVSSDTLWTIAARHCGGSENWPRLYDANAGTIEEAARAHGKSSSDHGHWIYPGTVLVLV